MLTKEVRRGLTGRAAQVHSVDSSATAAADAANNRAAASGADPSLSRPSGPDAAASNVDAALSQNPVRHPDVGKKSPLQTTQLNAPQAVRWMSTAFNVPASYGKITSRRAVGIFKRWTQIARLLGVEHANLAVAARKTDRPRNRRFRSPFPEGRGWGNGVHHPYPAQRADVE